MGIYDSKSYTDFCFLFCVDMIKPKKFLSNFGIPLLVPYTKDFERITQF